MDNQPNDLEQPSTEYPPNAPMAQPVNPVTINGNPIINTEVDNKEKKGLKSFFRLKIFLSVFISILIVFSSLLSYFFIFVPKAQAEEFIRETSKDLEAVKENLKKAGGGFGDVSTSFEISKGAFFEIPNMRSFKDSKVDTTQDIVDIKDTLNKIQLAREHKQKLNIPNDVEELNRKLDDYYNALGKAMNNLLNFEEYQLNMINAVGDDYQNQLEKLYGLVDKGEISRVEFIAAISETIRLGDISLARLKTIGIPPPEQKGYYDNLTSIETDRVATLRQMKGYYLLGSSEDDRLASDLLAGFSGRMKLVNDNNKALAQNIVKDSQLRTSFDETLSLENVLQEELNLLRKKYGIEDTAVNSPTPEASSSASPSNQATASSVLEATPSSY